MRFLFIASGRSVPSTRFRILPYLPLLEQAGHRCDVAYSFPEKYDYFKAIGWRASQRLKRLTRRWQSMLAGMRNYDAIVIEREVFDDDTWDVEARLGGCTNRLILDVDDGIHLLHPDKFHHIARMCDAAIAGNEHLAEVLRPHCSTVHLLPTCVRIAEYPPRDATSHGTSVPTVGWIGTTHNVAFLTVCAAALRGVARELPFRLLVVATSDERLPEVDLEGVDVEFRKWNPATEIDDLHQMDLGLMPLPADDPWMKYKCGLKLIQYLAVGIPAIASPVGVNAEILAGNAVGRAAESEAEWTAALQELLREHDLRSRLGAAGRKLVEVNYSIESRWKTLELILAGTEHVPAIPAS